VFAATPEQLMEQAELKPTLARALCRREYHDRAVQEVESAAKRKIRILTASMPEYPQRLRETPDYPHVLYVCGNTPFNSPHWLSVVGTRDMTPYGERVCGEILSELATLCPDTVIVSGLAYGIDITAHRAAMRAGLPTVGVVAHPLTHIYPARHTESARRMVQEGGAVVSEFHSGCRPDRSGFVQRNRIIAGLSEGTLIIESALRGGSLITADMAQGYDRTVMAVPGRVGDAMSEGTNRLLYTLAAQTVCSGEQVAHTLNWKTENAREASKAVQKELFAAIDPASTEGRLLALLDHQPPMSAEELGVRSGQPLQELASVLLELELSGAIQKVHGSFYVKA
ncbi:MAG: DNA-processing protein DprA, partial [Alistipes sp.]|nr:DNA-processing protein DprA [Alistipes sp.]